MRPAQADRLGRDAVRGRRRRRRLPRRPGPSSFGSTPRSASATISVAQWRSAPPEPMSGHTNRSRTSAARPPVDREHLAGAGAREVGAVGEEARGLLHGVVARIGRADERGLVADGERVDDAEPPAVPAGEGGPVQVEPPAEAKLGERQQLGGRAPAERGDGADLDEAGDTDQRRGPPPRDLPGRMAAQRLRRLRQIEPERLADAEEAVEKRVREPDVVVDDDRPVGIGARSRLQQPVQVLELAAGEAVRRRCARAAGRPPRPWRPARCARCGDSSAGRGATPASMEPSRYTPMTSTSSGDRVLRASRPARRRVPVTASIAPNASSPAVRLARRQGSVTSPPSPERNELGSGRVTGGAAPPRGGRRRGRP